MPLGPGKYDGYLTPVMEALQPDAAILIVLGGKDGNSFCVQAVEDIGKHLPDILRATANSIEQSLEGGTNESETQVQT